MIIECDNCSTRFRLNEDRVKGGGVKVRCTRCQNVFIVTPPEESKEELSPGQSEDTAAPAPPEEPANTGDAAKEPAPPISVGIPQEKPPEEEPDEEEEYSIPKLSFGELDLLSPSIDDRDEGVEEIVDSVYKDEFEPPDSTEGGGPKNEWPDPTDFSFDEEEPEATDVPDEGDAFFGILNDVIATDAEKPKPKEDAEGPAPPPPSQQVPIPTFSPKSGPALTGRPAQEKAAVPVGARATPKGSPVIGIFIAVLIFVGGGAAIYFSGIIDTLSGAFVTTAAGSSVKIDSLSGSFIENKRFGSIFVIKARLSNITGEGQLVSGVRATIYDSSGVAIEERTVSAGRVVSAEEIRDLPKKELLKRFNDASGATLPPKGSIPVMAPFAYAGRSIAEYGIDVLR